MAHTHSTVFQDKKRPVLEWDYEDYLDDEQCDVCGNYLPQGEMQIVRGYLICDDCLEAAEADAKNARYE